MLNHATRVVDIQHTHSAGRNECFCFQLRDHHRAYMFDPMSAPARANWVTAVSATLSRLTAAAAAESRATVH
jgi:hypothetical protein